jgi:predicted amidohydrolase
MTPPINTYRVAAIQFEPLLGAKDQNIAQLQGLVERAAQNGARLIVLPEMATTGYCWYSREEVAPFVEPIPGPTTNTFAELARRYACYIVIGMPEVAPHSGIFYNSAALVGPEGLVGVYRKTHSYVSELKWAKDGDLGLPVWDTPLGRIGILICMDGGYFEPARLLALAGADVLCFPTNWLDDKSPSAAWQARAFENGCYLIGANRYGNERGVQFSGGSCVLNPDGTVQSSLDTGNGIVYGQISLDAARTKAFNLDGLSEKLAARHPKFYTNMTLNSYLWNPIEFHGLYGHRPLPTGRRSIVAVAQFTPTPGDPEANIGQIERTLERLPANSSTDLVVFPEYILTGYPGEERESAFLSQDVGAWHERIIKLASRRNLYLVVGYVEQKQGQLFSSVVLAGPEGVLAHYSKTHVLSGDQSWCSAGTSAPPVVDLPLGRVGLLLGTDLCFPEPARCLAIDGCDLIVVAAGAGIPPVQASAPTAVPISPPGIRAADPSHFHLARQRAIENESYVAFASLPAPHGIGCSAIFGPDRNDEVVLSAYEADVASRIIDTSHATMPYPRLAAVRAKHLIGMRQTYLYEPLQIERDLI